MHDFEHIDDKLTRDRIAETSKGVLGYFVNRRRVALLVVGIILIAGIFAAVSLPREADPEVKVPIAVIVTTWPGASSADVEKLITDKIEPKIENLADLKTLASVSRNSLSSITVEFEADADLEDSIRKLRDEVNAISGLPEEAEDPEVIEVRIDDQAVVTLSLVGSLTDQELKNLGERVQDELEAISGVSRVELIGARTREIEVAINPGELNRLGVGINEVSQAIRLANLNMPLGEIESNGLNYSLRTIGEIKAAADLEKIVIKNTSQGTVLLGDVAVISDQLAEAHSISRIATKGESFSSEDALVARSTVSLQVYKSAGGNIIEVVDTAKEKVETLQTSGVIPEEVGVVVTNDISKFVRRDFNTLGRSGIQTLILIFIVLLIALSLRFALIALFSIPLIFLMGLSVISMQGSTLNSLTLFSLVLSLGLLIDTTIIILEGIFEGLQRGFGARESALYSIATYKWPIVSGVLTTIAAFIPMFLVGGIVGEFLKTLPLTISAVLGSSLFIGLAIMPPFAAYILKGASEKDKPEHNKFQQKVIDPLKGKYRIAIREYLKFKKARKRMYWGIAGLFVASFALIGTGILKTELFPQVDIGFIIINIEAPKGTILEITSDKTKEVEEVVKNIPELDNYVANIGSSRNFDSFSSGGSSNENLANVTVNLIDEEERKLKTYEIAPLLREKLTDIEGVRVTVEDIQGGPPTGAAVELRVLGDEFASISQIATDIKSMLASIDGVIDIESSDKPAPPEFVFKLDHERLGQLGVSAAHVSSTLRSAIYGAEVSEVTIGDEDIDIIVKYGSGVATLEEINNLEIINQFGRSIKVSQIAKVSLEPAVETIRHSDTKRVVNITASLMDTSAREVTALITEGLESISVPAGVEVKQGGEFEDEAQAFVDLYKAMIVAVLLIFFIMVLQFDSYKQPFVILATLPLAFIGVIFGTVLFGMPFAFSTFLGIVALGGIVVNDAIVLIARINDNLRNRQLEFNEAIAEAGEARLQPIILTTVTTILGVIPLAFADEFWRGLSVAIASGMLFATFLTLFVIPVLYQRFERKRWMKTHPENEIE